jgi:hypothetical protein
MVPVVHCTLTTFGCIGWHHKPIKVAPIASCPPPRLASVLSAKAETVAGAGEARYRGVVGMADSHQFGAYTE